MVSTLVACCRFYISNRLLSIFIHMEYIVTYLTAAGRFRLEIDEVKAQGAPQQTARTLTGAPTILAGPVDK